MAHMECLGINMVRLGSMQLSSRHRRWGFYDFSWTIRPQTNKRRKRQRLPHGLRFSWKGHDTEDHTPQFGFSFLTTLILISFKPLHGEKENQNKLKPLDGETDRKGESEET